MPSLSSQLAAIVGEDYLSESVEDRATWAIGGREPELVVTPGTVEELAAAVGTLSAAKRAIVPLGGGTRRTWGAPLSSEPFVVVRTTRLSRVREYEPDDLTISVEAGMDFATLDGLLAANNQMLPLDVAVPQQSTVGGALACGADGPRRLLYGSARDLLIGIQVVEASGRISKAGGMVVKNVSGFDMMKLYLGSLGSLAIIASANFKLIPRPRAAAALLLGCETLVQAAAIADMLAASQLAPAAVAYLSGYELPGAPATPHLLAILAEGVPAAVERIAREVTGLAQHHGTTLHDLRGATQAAAHAALCDLPRSDDLGGQSLALRLSCLPAELFGALAHAQTHAREAGVALAMTSHALNGIAYLRATSADPAALRVFHAALLGQHPNLALLGAPPHLATELPAWGRDVANRGLMQRIKTEFDPENRLNPSRFVV